MTSFFRLHSGGVVRNGAGVLFVGPSGAGKSTLVLRLVTDGFSLLSDDEVWIDPESLLLHPSTRSLLLKENAWDLFPTHREKFVPSGETECRSWWLGADRLRAGCRASPTPVWGLILLKPPLSHRPTLETIGQTEALTTVLKECMNFGDFGESGLTMLVRIVKSVKLFKLTNGDLNECADMLSRVLP
jgi:hypothetical protein